MANAGSLVVDMALNQAKFTGDLGKVVASVDNAAKRMQSSLRGVVGNFVGGLAGVLSVRAFVNIIEGSIDAADRLNDLSQVTGLAVETLGGLAFAAEKSGSDLEGVAKGVSRLNLQIAAAKAGNESAIQTFNALGLSMADIKNLSLEDVLIRVADRFAEWEDGANQAAIGNRLFKREFQSLIPLFNEGGQSLRENLEYFRRYGGITTEVAQKADAFNDTLTKLNLLNKAFATNVALALLPTLDSLAEAFVDASEAGNGFKDAAESIAAVVRGLGTVAVIVGGAFDGLGKSIGVTFAQIAAIARGEFASARQLGKDFEQENEERKARMNRTLEALLNPSSVPNKAPRPKRPTRGAPGLPDSGNDADAAAKKILDGEIKGIEAMIREESDLLKVRERFLQDYFQEDKLAFAEYFDTRRALIADHLKKEVAAYDQEIALLRAAQAKASKASDREDIENKIADVIVKRGKAERDAAVESIQLFREQEREAKKFRDTIEQVGIELARMNGDSAVAAIASFDLQNRALRERLDLERQSADESIRRQAEIGSRALDGLRQRIAAQATLNELQERFGQSLEGLSIATARISLARNSGALSELGALQAVSDANKGIIAQLREWEAQMAAVVATTGDPKMILALEQVRLQIETLSQETDLVGDKFRGIFRDSFVDAFASVIDGSKSAKDALLDFGKSVEQMISRIAVQNIAEALFGGAKGGGGGMFGGFIGDFFKSIFGGGGGGFGGFFADGGFPPPGKLSIVGERGPEVIMPRGSMQVIPNHQLGGGTTVHVTQTFAVTGPIDRRSQGQIAQAAGSGLRRAMSRYD
jgi:hypothetical protein